ncbi:hypothetical protein Salat_1033200 [Sesamum alatum]|uniref:Uncharacterized protein n=1 Tax=Sesamum alatum TaxID=300844 RepID=A0AAE2CSB8_9LAMI|nr:hypothetical protein Salat_1033200 [Sesamum alatum]
MTVTVPRNDKKMGFQAVTQQSELHLISARNMAKLVNEGSYGFVGQLHSIPAILSHESTHTDIEQLLAGYNDLFQEPQCLPPKRSIEHKIILKPDAVPKKMHPYRYSYAQKGVNVATSAGGSNPRRPLKIKFRHKIKGSALDSNDSVSCKGEP